MGYDVRSDVLRGGEEERNEPVFRLAGSFSAAFEREEI